MAIVTTARRADFDLIHARRDLLRYFEFVLTIEDTQSQDFTGALRIVGSSGELPEVLG